MIQKRQIQNIQKWTVAGLGCLISLGVGLDAAQGAEQVVLTYGDLSLDIPIQDLSDLAETGEPSTELGALLDLANQEPETLQEALNGSIPMNAMVLRLVLNSPPWRLAARTGGRNHSILLGGRQQLGPESRPRSRCRRWPDVAAGGDAGLP
jgi:hypothetical protein